MSKFKVGDKVVIKKDLKEEEFYGDNWVNSTMAELAGQEATITGDACDGDYEIDLDEGEYYWNKEMFEEVNTSTNPTIEIPSSPTSQTLVSLNVKIEIDPNSLKEVEEQIKTLQDKLNNLKLKLVF